VISRTLPIGPAVLAELPALRLICKHGTGVDNIDVAAARAAGVVVARTEGVNARSVAELAIGLALATARRLVPLASTTAAGVWDRTGSPGEELSEKTLGLVGFGRIGHEVARIGGALFGRVLVHDPFTARDAVTEVGAVPVDLPTLKAQADVLSLHCPLTEQTRGMVDAAFLSALRPGAYLINTARGEIVDEAALLAALDTGHLAGAGLDTLVVEGSEPTPLKRHPRVVVTPHVGASTRQALVAVADRTARIVVDALAGLPLKQGERVC
jgi:D-3-phosphoglycerate dehydrogenase